MAHGMDDRFARDPAMELERRQAQLRERAHQALVESGESDLQEVAGRVRDSGEEAVADLISGLNFNRLNQIARELDAVETALARLREGNYGFCDDCGNEIDPARLEVMPSAQRCIECQEKWEHQARAGGMRRH